MGSPPGNCISQLPPGCLSGLTSLTDLTLAGNRLTDLPPGELEPLTALRKLALNGNRLGQGRDTGAQGPLPLGMGRHMSALQELMLQVCACGGGRGGLGRGGGRRTVIRLCPGTPSAQAHRAPCPLSPQLLHTSSRFHRATAWKLWRRPCLSAR